MLRHYFRILGRVLTFRDFSLKGLLILAAFYILLAILILPVVFSITKKLEPINQVYCYYLYDSNVSNGVGVRDKSSIAQVYKHINEVGRTRFEIPDNDPFIMDTVTIKAGELVSVYAYSEDSTYAYISSINYWYDSKARISKEMRFSYVPLFILHDDLPSGASL